MFKKLFPGSPRRSGGRSSPEAVGGARPLFDDDDSKMSPSSGRHHSARSLSPQRAEPETRVLVPAASPRRRRARSSERTNNKGSKQRSSSQKVGMLSTGSPLIRRRSHGGNAAAARASKGKLEGMSTSPRPQRATNAQRPRSPRKSRSLSSLVQHERKAGGVETKEDRGRNVRRSRPEKNSADGEMENPAGWPSSHSADVDTSRDSASPQHSGSKSQDSPQGATRRRDSSHDVQYSTSSSETSSDSLFETSTSVTRHSYAGPEIAPSEITILEQIGVNAKGEEKGRQSSVYKGLRHGTLVCVKKVKLGSGTSPKALGNFENEVRVMSQVNHENICLFLGAFLNVQKREYTLVTEYCPGGDVADLLKDSSRYLSSYEKFLMIRDVSKGMLWLHFCGILHLDLKPENLLLDAHGIVKVCDFGYSFIGDASRLEIVNLTDVSDGGSPIYMAPERLANRKFGMSADIYSFGLIVWQILTRQDPYWHHQVTGKLSPFKNAIVRHHERPPIPFEHAHNKQLVSLLQRCWNRDPEQRPTFDDILPVVEDLLVDSAIRGEHGRNFWKENFIVSSEDIREDSRRASPANSLTQRVSRRLLLAVSWDDFAVAFGPQMVSVPAEIALDTPPFELCSKRITADLFPEMASRADEPALTEFAKLSDIAAMLVEEEFRRREQVLRFNCLRRLLCVCESAAGSDRDDEVVALDRFGMLLDVFHGPHEMMEWILFLMNQTYFHGDMTKREAYELLKDKELGAFVVRFSSTRHTFVISSVSMDTDQIDSEPRVQHSRIEHHYGKGFSLPNQDEVYRDLDDLLNKNAERFCRPQAMEATKYRYLTSVARQRDSGYEDEDLHDSFSNLKLYW